MKKPCFLRKSFKSWSWWQKALLSFGPPLLVGFLGSILMAGSLDIWYQTLNKASFNPPAWVFGPAWTLLYFLMGLATYWILDKKFSPLKLGAKCLQWEAIKFYLIQICLNFAWTPVFFVFRQTLSGLAVLIALLIVFIIMTRIYARLDKKTLWCLLPNIAWLCFATLLNLMIVILN